MTVRIPYSVAREIAEHAASQAPREVCGLLAGTAKQIVRSFPVTNVALSPETEYRLDAVEQLRTMKGIDDCDLQLIGVYHSHPQSPPILSETDIEQALDHQLLHLVVSISSAKPKLKLWRVEEDQVAPIDLVFDAELTEVADEPLQTKQGIAMLVVGISSLLILLAISFALLPPAPVIGPIP